MARQKAFLTDEQWAKIAPLLPKRKANPKGGRPRCDERQVLEGILWILKTGAPWADLPTRYPSRSTCHRRLSQWEAEGVWIRIWRLFLGELDEQGLVEWNETFADATFMPAKKGAAGLGKPAVAKARSLWWWSTARVFLWEASPRLLRRAKQR